MMIEDHLEDMREHLPEIDMMIGAHQETDMMIGVLHETDMMIEVIILIVGIESLVGCSCLNPPPLGGPRSSNPPLCGPLSKSKIIFNK
jgi:hypothetical protein